MLQNSLSRVFFLSKGCKQVPPDENGGKILWGHPDGYFLNAQGQKVKDNFSPAMKVSKPNMHAAYPIMRQFSRNCHLLMALAFYGERPTYTDKNGKPYVGIVHHLIPDKLDYRPANLLCWLTREQHRIADDRQKALRTVVPDGDLHVFSYERLRYLQDPCTLSDEEFQKELEVIREMGYQCYDPHELSERECERHCEN